jgi:hypothetical protein
MSHPIPVQLCPLARVLEVINLTGRGIFYLSSELSIMNSQLLIPDVITAITNFEKSSTPGVWAIVEKKQLIAEMQLRLNDAFQINQGTQPLWSRCDYI